MIPNTFSYVKPASLDELFPLMREEGSCLYAGGTDVLVYLRDGNLSPKTLIDVKALAELRSIRETEGGYFVGAAEPVQDVAKHPLLQPFAALCQGAGSIGCMELRNRATIGGNICNGSPSADSVPGLLVHDARVSLLSENGRRTVALCDFLLAPGKAALEPGEIMEGVLLPKPVAGAQSRYYRRTRVKGMDLSGISAAIYCEAGKELANIRIAFGALYKTVSRARSAEGILNAGPLDAKNLDEKLDAAVAAILSEVNPRKTSLRASPAYKKAMVPVLIRKGLEEMCNDVLKGGASA